MVNSLEMIETLFELVECGPDRWKAFVTAVAMVRDVKDQEDFCEWLRAVKGSGKSLDEAERALAEGVERIKNFCHFALGEDGDARAAWEAWYRATFKHYDQVEDIEKALGREEGEGG